jgi:anti-sigma B factor antagonist
MSARCATQFEVQDIAVGGRHTLVLIGELDIASAPQIEALIPDLCANGTTGIALDLSKLTFIDCCGLRVVLSLRELCQRRGYEFTLTHGTDAVDRVFALTGLADSLPFVRGGFSPPTMIRNPWKVSAPARVVDDA